MATDWDIIKVETAKIKERFDLDLDDSTIIIEVLKQFNGADRTFFSDIDTKKLRDYLFTKEKDKAQARLYELTGRQFNERESKVSKTVQETAEWQYTMHGYFST